MWRMKTKISEQLDLTSQPRLACRSARMQRKNAADVGWLQRLAQALSRALHWRAAPPARPQQIWLRLQISETKLNHGECRNRWKVSTENNHRYTERSSGGR
jgi:hypothetical protein